MQNPNSIALQPLAHNSTSRVSSETLLVLPAYLALALATGAACYGISHYTAISSFSRIFYSSWILAMLISVTSLSANSTTRRLATGGRWLLMAGLLPLLALTNPYFFLPREAIGEGQQVIAIIFGWFLIASILVAGTRYGQYSFPIAMPLIPGLTIFGLLNESSVDNVITLAFLVYIAASLYLVVYEWMLIRNARETAVQQLLSENIATPGSARALQFNSTGGANKLDVGGIALQYLLACSAWFACFIISGILIYYPAKAVLPEFFRPALGSAQDAMRRTLDWRRPRNIMQLQGGFYTLSDQEVLKVTVQSGQSTGLWQSRIYENYRHSIWTTDFSDQQSQQVTLTPDQLSSLGRQLPALAPQLGERQPIVAEVTLLAPVSRTLLSNGELIEVNGPWNRVSLNPTGTVARNRFEQEARSYTIKSMTTRVKRQALENAPGLSPAEVENWKKARETSATLQLPDQLPGTTAQLRDIVAQIKQSALAVGNPMETPHQKVRAISDYLYKTCEYSLVVPTVPVNKDAVIFFLTESRQGACDMFASSMAMLLRAMDVPARVATGYLETEEQDQVPNGTAFTFRERDAHAWTQYYVPSAGWLDFDPTAGTRTTQISLEARLSELLHWRQLRTHWQAFLLPLMGLLLLLIGGVWSVVDLRREQALPKDLRNQDRTRIARAYTQAVHLLSRRVPHGSHYTPQEYEAAICRAELTPAVKQDFAALTYLFTMAHYAAPHLKVDEAQLQSCLDRLRQQLR